MLQKKMMTAQMKKDEEEEKYKKKNKKREDSEFWSQINFLSEIYNLYKYIKGCINTYSFKKKSLTLKIISKIWLESTTFM